MAENVCPKCGAIAQPTDTQCLDCGADLLEARLKQREQWQQQSVAGRTGASEELKIAGAGAAAAGRAVAGETSEETRLRVFDQQEAKKLQQEAAASLLLAIIALLAGLVLLGLGLMRMKTLGIGEVFGLRPVDLRTFGGLANPHLVALVLTGVGLGGLLAGIGLFLRWAACRRAVGDVERGEKPEIVGLNGLLAVGLLCLAVFCPPAGLILGIILRFSSDSDIAGFGGLLIWISLALILLVIGNMLYGRLAKVAASAQAGAASGKAVTPEAGG